MEEPAYKNTRHQVPRGSRPDAADEKGYYLFKNVTVMHATYQVRVLAYFAWKSGKKLIIQVPTRCTKSESLSRFIKEHPKLVQLEKVS